MGCDYLSYREILIYILIDNMEGYGANKYHSLERDRTILFYLFFSPEYNFVIIINNKNRNYNNG